MKKTASTGILLLLALTTSQASAQSTAFSYAGTPLVKKLIGQLVAAPGRDCGDIDFIDGRPLRQGQDEMLRGFQDTALMVKPLDADVCAGYPDARQVVVAKERLPLLVNSNVGYDTCDLIMTNDVAGYESDAPQWAEALQLVYGGVNGQGTPEACSAPARANLIQNWSSLWLNNCQDSKCDALRFAFRRGDDDSTTKLLKRLLGLEAFCNGAQNQDQDPLRTDCRRAVDVDWCPDGNLGVVQAVELSSTLPVYPRIGCVKGKFEFGTKIGAGNCPDGSPAFAGFLCAYPQDCLDRFGCINSLYNGSPLNLFMDGRVYNELKVDRRLRPLEIPETGSPSFIYFNGHCTGGNDGTRTDRQLGCLVDQVSCSMAVTTAMNVLVPVTETSPGDACAEEFNVPSRAAVLNNSPINFREPGYPLLRPVFMSTLDVPVEGNKLDCDAIGNAEEQEFCRCVFNKSVIDLEAPFAFNDPVPDYKVVGCGDIE